MTAQRTDDDPYAILGVPRGSSDRAIAAAHRALARRYHPDLAGESGTARMIRVNAAYDAIRTARRRAAFDALDGWTAPPADGDDEVPARTRRSASVVDRASRGEGHDGSRWGKERDGTAGAGPPPGRPSGSVLGFGRHQGWSIGEIARIDPGYLEWLEDRREGQPYADEIAATLERVGFRQGVPGADDRRERRRRLFRRG